MCRLLDQFGTISITKNKPLVCYRWFDTDNDGSLSPVSYSLSKTWNAKIAEADYKPNLKNNSGLHVYKTKSLARSDRTNRWYILAKVEIWGDCVEHENGYRAEFAKILEIYPTKNSVVFDIITKKRRVWEEYEFDVKKDFVKVFKANKTLAKNLSHVKIVRPKKRK